MMLELMGMGWELSVRLGPAAEEARRQRLFVIDLSAALDEEPIEDGMDHPAEEVISDLLESERQEVALRWIRDACLNVARPSLGVVAFVCASRHPDIGSAAWRAELVRDGLRMDDVEVRDAVVQAAENWGDSACRQALEGHSESVPWLREYIEGVIEDLGGSSQCS